MDHLEQRFTVVALCVLLLTAVGGNCSSDVETRPASLSQPPPDLKKIIDSQVKPLLESKGRVGIVVGIIDGDKQWVVGYGCKSLVAKTAPDGDSLFEIGSVTKTFTAVLLSIMSENGQVNLKDPVGKCLPGSVRVPSFQGKKITLEHLAVHTSGLPRIPDDLDDPKISSPLNPYARYTNEHMYKYLGRCRLSTVPGTKCEYSNLGAGLLGLALSRARGSSYESMVKSLVCKPLAMNDTVITLSKDQRARLVPGYMLEKQGSSLTAVLMPNWTFLDSFAGAGALRSTANDMLRYLAANIGITPTPLKDRLQFTHKVRHKIDDIMSMGLAWHVLKLPDIESPIIWHNGGTYGYNSFIAFSRESKVGVVLLSNTTSYGLGVDESPEDEVGLKLMVIMMNGNYGEEK